MSAKLGEILVRENLLTPQQLRVHGSVEVRFVMSAPDLEVFRR